MSHDPRALAANALLRVERDAAFAAAVIAHLRREHDLPPNAGAQFNQLVLGTLRAQSALDAILAPRLKQPLGKLDGYVRQLLRLALYELTLLGHAEHGVVNSYVNLCKQRRSAPLGRLVNAVLRGLLREGIPALAPFALPGWLESALKASLSPERFAAYRDRRLPPPTCVALREAAPDLGAIALEQHPSPYEATAWRLRGMPADAWLEAQGQVGWVQEEGSQLVAAALQIAAGDRVLDACAGRGHKSLALRRRWGTQIALAAADNRPEKLELLKAQAEALGWTAPELGVHGVDWTRGAGTLKAETFDCVLVDAPCTGLGTVHRRPEIMHRLAAEDVPQRAARQLAILEGCAERVRPGGRLYFCVCSPLREESDAVVEVFAQRRTDFKREALAGLSGLPADADGCLRLGPWLDQGTDGVPEGTDAYQLWCLRRR